MAKVNKQEAARRVTPEEVMRRMDQGEPVTFVDTRNPQAWGLSNEKLPGAIRIPADEVDQHLGAIPKDASEGRPKGHWIVTYCT
jgi:predicted sulfurtransferase